MIGVMIHVAAFLLWHGPAAAGAPHASGEPVTPAHPFITNAVTALEQLDSLSFRAVFTYEGNPGGGPRKCELTFDVRMGKGGRLRICALRDGKELGGLITRGGEDGEIIEWDHGSRRWTRYRGDEWPDTPMLLWPVCEDERGLKLYLLRGWTSWLDKPSAYAERFENALREGRGTWSKERIGDRTCNVLTVISVIHKDNIEIPEDSYSIRDTVRLAIDQSSHLPVLNESLSEMFIPPERLPDNPDAGTGGQADRAKAPPRDGLSSQSVLSDRPSYEYVGTSRDVYKYEDMRSNPPIDDRTFTFEPPAGFERVDPDAIAMRPTHALVGKSVAGWMLESLDGRKIDIAAEARDSCLVLVTWATWCTPCKAELRRLAELSDSDRFRGRFKVIAVNVEKNRKRAEAFLERSPLPFAVAYDPGFQERLGVSALPATLVVNHEALVKAMTTGWGDGTTESPQEKRILRALIDCAKTRAETGSNPLPGR